MSEILLQTKLIVPPLRPSLIPRRHLDEKLREGLKGKLTLVSAPAGFGKTTLISAWVQQAEQMTAWLSLDEEDNESGRFLMYMIAALQKAREGIGETASALLQSNQLPSLDTFLTILINDLAQLSSKIILVLDDYHVIHNLNIHKGMTFLLENQPQQLHIIIISREDPALPLHRLRSRGQVTGIYIKDLRFSIDEAALFLNDTMGLCLTTAEITSLGRRTEGWVAGLQLAALSMQDMADTHEFITDFAGNERYITDYLFAEVIARQPDHIQNFLQKTSIIDRFCVSLCDAILGLELDTNEPGDSLPSKAIIEQLDRANLFIVTLDNKREWYRYHHLFADFLRLRLHDLLPDEIVELHRRAAVWYKKQGFTVEAIQHFLAVKDFPQVAELIELVGIRLISQGQLRMMLGWLAELPNDFIGSRPLLCVYQAWIFNVTGQGAASEKLLKKAEEGLATIESSQAQHIKGLIEMVRAYQARRQGDLLKSVELLSQAAENLSARDLRVRSTVNLNLGFNYLLMGRLDRAEQVLEVARVEGTAEEAVYITLIAMAVQANNYLAQGKLSKAITLYEETINNGLAHNRGQPSPLAGYAYAGLGQVMYEQNEFEKAELFLELAVQLGESVADWSIVRRGLLPLAWLMQMKGDTVAARKLWQQALDVVQQAVDGRVEALVWAQWARMQLVQAASDSDALAVAEAWADAYRKSRPDPSNYQETVAQMTLAHVELVQGQVDQSIWRLDRLAEAATAGGQYNNLIKIRILNALAYDAKGDATTALEILGQALTLAETEGYIRSFIDHGPPLQRLLQGSVAGGLTSNYVFRLLSAFPTAPQQRIPSPQPATLQDSSPVGDPLTKKEKTILRLMAAGLTNREIAAELFLSVNTVKVYASRLYDKLDAHRRAEAVARAKELGFL